MIESRRPRRIMNDVRREDRALLRSNPSARRRGHLQPRMPPPFRSSFGLKAKNLTGWAQPHRFPPPQFRPTGRTYV